MKKTWSFAFKSFGYNFLTLVNRILAMTLKKREYEIGKHQDSCIIQTFLRLLDLVHSYKTTLAFHLTQQLYS